MSASVYHMRIYCDANKTLLYFIKLHLSRLAARIKTDLWRLSQKIFELAEYK